MTRFHCPLFQSTPKVYLKDYRDVPAARQGLGNYFPFYNEQRIHQALDYRTPKDVHFAPPSVSSG
jgi:putative transposase